MRARITLSVATIALGAVILSAPAFAQTYSNMGKDGHPISVNGLGAAANSMGGPGYQDTTGANNTKPMAYSNMKANGDKATPEVSD